MSEEMKKNIQNENESIVSEYEEITNRLDRLDEKVEFVCAEISQRTGQKVGRDVGILYGIFVALLLIVIYFILSDNVSIFEFI